MRWPTTSLFVVDVRATGVELPDPLTYVFDVHTSFTINFHKLAMNVDRWHFFKAKNLITERISYFDGDARGSSIADGSYAKAGGQQCFKRCQSCSGGTKEYGGVVGSRLTLDAATLHCWRPYF